MPERLADDRFCPRCQLSTDLHPGIDAEPTEFECGVAAKKADVLDRYARIFMGAR